MTSLGYYKMRIPSTGAEVVGEKFSIYDRIVFVVKGHYFAEGKLEVVEKVEDKGILPACADVPWNRY